MEYDRIGQNAAKIIQLCRKYLLIPQSLRLLYSSWVLDFLKEFIFSQWKTSTTELFQSNDDTHPKFPWFLERMSKKTRPDTRPSVACGWAGAVMLKNRRKIYFYESIMDGPMDRRTDGWTPSYRVTSTRRKIWLYGDFRKLIF